MPILHIHTPREILTVSPKRLAHHDWILDALRDLGAQATTCEPGFLGDVTPPLLRRTIPRRATMWLQVDETGENAALMYHEGPGKPSPKLYGYTEDEFTAIILGHDPEYRIGPEYSHQVSISSERGRGFTYQTLIGGAVLHSTVEEAAAIMQSFESPQPPPLAS